MADGDTNSRQRAFIDILDNDSLLNIFYHCRPAIMEGDGIDTWDIDSRIDIFVPGGKWERERWWYKPAQVCRRWRHLILASPSYLGLSLVCASGTPVADMLAHSPPFPLIIDHPYLDGNITAEDVEGTRLALEHHDRVRRIRFRMLVPRMMGLIAAIDGLFPLLEYLYISPLPVSSELLDMHCFLPSTLRAPHLRHLVLQNMVFPIISPLLEGLVTLSLECTPSAHIGPTELLQRLSLMPHLETFRITFFRTLFNQNVERQLLRMPISTHATIPNLRWFGFGGPSAYMEAVLPRITVPLLKVVEIVFTTSDLLNLTSSALFTLQFMCKTGNPRLRNIQVTFKDAFVVVTMYPHELTGIMMPILRLRLLRPLLFAGLNSTTQVSDGIRAVLTEVESLTLEDKTSLTRLKGYYPVCAESRWRELLKSFDNVRTLHVSGGDLIEGLTCSLQPHDGESAIELLPMLRVLSCPKGTHVGESCRSFIAVRRNAGYPVTISFH